MAARRAHGRRAMIVSNMTILLTLKSEAMLAV